jgi:PST family polysaccharide transporter
VKAILRATLVLSGNSLVTILVGLVSAKASAVLLGPGGFGAMGLLLALLGLAGLLAGMGIGAGLIRMGAISLAGEDRPRVAALYRAAWLLCWTLGGLAALILVVFRTPISRLMLGGPEHAAGVPLLAVALLFNLASTVQTSLLNTYHRLTALVRIGIITSVAGTATTLSLLWLWREQGILPAIVAGSVVGWLVSTAVLRRERIAVLTPPAAGAVLAAAAALLRFGGPYTASALVGTGVQFALPAVVLHALSAADVGYYRAATSIAAGYLGFLLLAMGQDYFPRISAAGDRPAELCRLVNQQQQLVMLVAVPLVLATLACAPLLVPVVYSPQFLPAAEILEWQLIGDLFKFSSWTMGFAILARSGSLTLFLVEAAFGVNTIISSFVCVRLFGVTGLGISFLFSYIVHYIIVWLTVRKQIGFTWSSVNSRMLTGAVLAALLVRTLPLAGLADWRAPIALLLAAVSGAVTLYMLWKELDGLSYLEGFLHKCRLHGSMIRSLFFRSTAEESKERL